MNEQDYKDMVAYERKRQSKIDAMTDDEFIALMKAAVLKAQNSVDPMDAALRLLEEAA